MNLRFEGKSVYCGLLTNFELFGFSSLYGGFGSSLSLTRKLMCVWRLEGEKIEELFGFQNKSIVFERQCLCNVRCGFSVS